MPSHQEKRFLKDKGEEIKEFIREEKKIETDKKKEALKDLYW